MTGSSLSGHFSWCKLGPVCVLDFLWVSVVLPSKDILSLGWFGGVSHDRPVFQHLREGWIGEIKLKRDFDWIALVNSNRANKLRLAILVEKVRSATLHNSMFWFNVPWHAVLMLNSFRPNISSYVDLRCRKF